MRQFFEFADQNCIEIDQLLSAQHGELRKLVFSSRYVSASLICSALELVAARVNKPCVGIEFSEWLNLRRFGPLSLATDNCGSFKQACELMRKYLHVENQSVVLDLEDDDEDVRLVFHLCPVSSPSAPRQFAEALLATIVRLGRVFLGDATAPQGVEFCHAAPSDKRPIKRFFRCPLTFDAERNTITYRTEDMSKEVSSYKPELVAFIKERLDELSAGCPGDFRGKVERIIVAMLPSGNVSLPCVAAALGMTPRTLQRRLGALGMDFAKLLEEIRLNLAQEYLGREGQPKLAKLASVLGYSEASSASRFMRRKQERTQASCIGVSSTD